MKFKSHLFLSWIALGTLFFYTISTSYASQNCKNSFDKKENSTSLLDNPLINLEVAITEGMPFDKIRPHHFVPAIEFAIIEAEAKIKTIKNLKKVSFKGTIEAIAHLNQKTEFVSFLATILSGLDSQYTKVSDQLNLMNASFENKIHSDETLYDRAYKFRFLPGILKTLTHEQKELLDSVMSNFEFTQVNEDPIAAKNLKKLESQIVKVKSKIADRIYEPEKYLQVYITEKKDLAGLSNSTIQAAKDRAIEKGKPDQWLLVFKDYEEILPFSQNRALREKFYKYFRNMNLKGDTDTSPLILKLLRLRYKKYKEMEYFRTSDYQISQNMLKSSKELINFLKKMKVLYNAKAGLEMEEIKKFAKENGIEKMENWDLSFYKEKLRKKISNLNQKEMLPYFEVQNVLKGIFEIINKLHNVEFKESKKHSVYHPDVKAYEVYSTKQDELIGLLYVDLFARDNKTSNGEANAILNYGYFQNQKVKPQVIVSLGFQKRKNGTFLNLHEIPDLFHEMGHAMDFLFSKVKYSKLSDGEGDFNEFPADFMENYVFNKDALKIYAKHYKTKKPIPDSFIEKIKKHKSLFSGLKMLTTIRLSLLDFALHYIDPYQINDLKKFEYELTKDFNDILSQDEFFFRFPSFGHLTDYPSVYYTYAWAYVLSAHAFEMFEKQGVFNQKLARSLRINVLEKGKLYYGRKLYFNFRKINPTIRSAIKKDGMDFSELKLLLDQDDLSLTKIKEIAESQKNEKPTSNRQ